MNYKAIKKIQSEQDILVDNLSEKINKYKKNKNGVVPFEVRYSAKFKKDKKEFDIEFNILKDINKLVLKNFKKEEAESRKNRFNKKVERKKKKSSPLKQNRLSTLKKGDIFNFIGKKKEYMYSGKTRGKNSKFTYEAMDDISSFYETKTDRIISIS